MCEYVNVDVHYTLGKFMQTPGKWTADEFAIFERTWKGIFGIFGAALVVVLTDIVALSPNGTEKFWCYLIGGISVVVCMYAARKLQDIERVHATVDASVLLDSHSHSAAADGDD